MIRPVSRRKNVKRSASGRTKRLPDVPGVKIEQAYWELGAVVVGIDEVGRGAWAGPVTYGAVVLPNDRRMYKLRDSKQLDEERREELYERVGEFAIASSVGHASNDEIDRIGMSAAMKLAARRAVEGLAVCPDVILLDGNWDFLDGFVSRRGCPTYNVPVVYGDSYSASIAAASIMAKVTRDRLMTEAAEEFPDYGFESNKGYPAPAHTEALDEVGACRLHRHSWAPIAALKQEALF